MKMGKLQIENKLKTLPYVKDYHIEKMNTNQTRTNLNVSRFKVRVWVIEHLYVANLLSGNRKIEDSMKNISQGFSIVLDIFYIK
jgi:hypothetical protein